ncbi:MAG: OmpP1/FadL family transporter [Pseudobdellovibrionaceae bacterium]
MPWILQLFLIASPSSAFFENYSSTLIGEQSAGMGGAYTAGTKDSSALGYYNPAGFSRLERSSISASIIVFKKVETDYAAESDIVSAGLRANQGFFQSQPTSGTSVIRSRFGNFALSFLGPDFSTFGGEVQISDTNTSLLNYRDISQWMGVSYAKPVTETLDVGVSLFYTARQMQKIVTDRTIVSADSARIFNSEKVLTANSIVPILGIQYRLGEATLLGVSYRNMGVRVSGSASYYSNFYETGGTVAPEKRYTKMVALSRIPERYALGIAHRFPYDILVHLDVIYHPGFTENDVKQPEAREVIRRKSITNYALGLEKEVVDKVNFRFGIFTDYAAVKNPSSKSGFQQTTSINKWGFSANLSYQENPSVAYVFGGYYVGGTGKAVERVDHEYQELTVQNQTFTMLIGTSYFF